MVCGWTWRSGSRNRRRKRPLEEAGGGGEEVSRCWVSTCSSKFSFQCDTCSSQETRVGRTMVHSFALRILRREKRALPPRGGIVAFQRNGRRHQTEIDGSRSPDTSPETGSFGE